MSAPAEWASTPPAAVLSPKAPSVARLRTWPLVAATYFLVCGSAYGTEQIVGGAGYGMGVLILLLTPVLWSLPAALMIGELASMMPAEGGFYAWVRRAMGNFWGFQEAWLSLMASIFDMAIYPTLFVIYLSRLFPWFGEEGRGVLVGLAMVAVCTALNVAGIRVVALTSEWFFFLIVSPFIAIAVLAPFKAGQLAAMPAADGFGRIDLIGGILIAMWNYMGWDNASTIAAEVDRPQRTYPRAMLIAVGLVAITYVIPVAAMWLTGLPTSAWGEGSWVAMAEMVGGPGLRVALALGGAISAFGMFNALVMSYSRLPLAMAQDGMLPRAFARLHPRTRAPWVAILACSIGWAACLGLGFERLVTIDILLYGLSLGLEFVALVVLRIKEPDAPRPFRVPGGTVGTILLGVPPVLLLGFSIVRSQREEVFGINGIVVGLLLIVAGCVAFGLTRVARSARARQSEGI